MQNLVNQDHNYLEKFIMIRTNEGENYQKSSEFKHLINQIKLDCLQYIEDYECQYALEDIEDYILKYGIENFENLHMLFKLLKGSTSMEAIYCWLQLDKRSLEDQLPAEIDIDEVPLLDDDLCRHNPLDRAIEICDLYHVKRARSRHLKEYWDKKKYPNENIYLSVEDVNIHFIAVMAIKDYQSGMYIQDIVAAWNFNGYNKSIIDEVLKDMSVLDEHIGNKFTRYYQAHYEYVMEEMQIQKRRCFY